MNPQDINSAAIEEILNNVDYGVNIVDRSFDILYMNKASRVKFNMSEMPEEPRKCHELLFNNPEPCTNCPILRIDQTDETFGQLVDTLNTPDRPQHRVKYHKLEGGRYVQTLADITRETELVRQVTLQSKETQAQNIILKRKRQEMEEHSTFLDSVFNAITSGIMVLDSAQNLSVTSANKAVGQFLGDPSGEPPLRKKCYQIFGYQRRCPGCPIEHANDKTNYAKLRYHQKLGDYTLTEIYSRLPDGKMLLIFEDSTKRVALLQQVKEHKETIEWQNQIFRSLLETSTTIQQKQEMEEVFEVTLKELRDLFQTSSFGVILDGERPEIVDCAVFVGMGDEEQQVIIENHTKLLDPKIGDILASRLKSEPHPLIAATPQGEEKPSTWLVLPMQGRERKLLGKLLIKGPELDTQSREIVTLFLEQVSAVSETKMLTQKLEKMANTDGLTGAYNRAYYDRELEKAIDNASKYQHIRFSILLIDVNGLKRVNDVFGHEDGDTMIIRVANLLTEVCRKSDVVTRLGGDEFVVLAPATGYDQARILLGRIRDKESKTSLVCRHPDGTEEVVPIRMSIGLASSEDTPPELVAKTADKRMYDDKEAFYANKERYR